MTFTAVKLSFIKKSLNFFTEKATKEPGIILAERAIIEAPDHVKVPANPLEWRRVKGYVDFYIGNILTEDGRLIAFRIGKKHLASLGTYSDKNFGEEEKEIFPSSTILWSADTQTIFIEKPKKDQMEIPSIIRNLQAYLNGRLLEYGYTVLMAPLPYKSSFWKVMDSYDVKYHVKFTLFAPNFLSAEDEAKRLVEFNQKEFNADGTSIELINEEGKLHISKENDFINSALRRIESGAGKWAAKVGINNKKRWISSETESMVVDNDLSNYDTETAKEFTKKAVDIIDEKEKGDGNNDE